MKYKFATGLCVLLTTISSVEAGLIDLGASLNGAQQVPSVNTDAFGLSTVRYDDVAKTLDVKLIAEGISLNELAENPGRFHIHGPAGLGSTAGVIVQLGALQNFEQFGQLISFEAIGVPLPDPGVNEPLLLSGQTYLNLHTVANPSGEIRGQILGAAPPIPEPGTLTLACFGFAILGCMSRRFGRRPA